MERLHEIHFSPSGLCKVVGLNNSVRKFGLRFHCNGIKQLAIDFLKACPVYQDKLPFLPFPFHYALSAPTAHMNGYRLILLIWHLARSGHRIQMVTAEDLCLWAGIVLEGTVGFGLARPRIASLRFLAKNFTYRLRICF